MYGGETGRRGDGETGRQGGREAGRQGGREAGILRGNMLVADWKQQRTSQLIVTQIKTCERGEAANYSWDGSYTRTSTRTQLILTASTVQKMHQ